MGSLKIKIAEKLSKLSASVLADVALTFMFIIIHYEQC